MDLINPHRTDNGITRYDNLYYTLPEAGGVLICCCSVWFFWLPSPSRRPFSCWQSTCQLRCRATARTETQADPSAHFLHSVERTCFGSAALLQFDPFQRVALPHPLPHSLGIAFITLQNIGYLLDVSHGVISAEHNPDKLLAVYLFFAKLPPDPLKPHAASCHNSNKIILIRRKIYNMDCS
jgi:hypothetical protein